MALTSSSLILNFFGALLPTISALRTHAGPSTPLVKIPWEDRPVAETASKSCVLTPTWKNDFSDAKRLLLQMYAKAEDTVPLFVMTTSESEAESWKTFIGDMRGSPLPPQTVLSLEGVLKQGTPGDKRYAANFTGTIERINHQRDKGCVMGTGGGGRTLGGAKKFYGARHLGREYGCDFVWVMDCDSQPMRNFSFAEAFGRVGKIWVVDGEESVAATQSGDLVGGLVASGRMSVKCAYNAQIIAKKPLSQKVRRMALRQNDFWLFETRLLSHLMDQGTQPGRAKSAGRSSPGDSFLDAWLEGGQVSEQIVWNAWLIQNLLDGTLGNQTDVDYKIVTVRQTSESLARIFFPESAGSTTWAPRGDNLLLNAERKQGFLWAEFGKYWYDTLGQAGIWGDYLHDYPMEPNALKEFAVSVPWCVSNCQNNAVQKQLDVLAGAAAAK